MTMTPPSQRSCQGNLGGLIGLIGTHDSHQWVDDTTDTIYWCPGRHASLRADDEPTFTIRAQDILAPQALAAYAALARKLDLHDHAQRVEAIAVDFLAWQAAHHHQVKRPD